MRGLMDSEAIANRSPYPPAPPAGLPPAPPAAPAQVAVEAPVAAAVAAAPARKPLTLANWLKASLLGFGLFFGVNLAGGMLGTTNYGAVGLAGWIVGALAGSYIVGMRYVKAYLAVFGGVFLGILAFDVVVLNVF